jgi:hypothetical protein
LFYELVQGLNRFINAEEKARLGFSNSAALAGCAC